MEKIEIENKATCLDGVFVKTSSPKFRKGVHWLLVNTFGIDVEYADNILSKKFDDFVDHLKEDIVAYIEPVYVDKVYRDSYYTYYASKPVNISKNCIRISFFEDNKDAIKEGEIDYGQYDYLKRCYRGFVVLRPTIVNVVGRNAISPEIVKKNGFKVCKTAIESTVGGCKFEVEAFPAASQDSETMTCAETAVWSMMEYFGNRYPEYTPLLPSNILNILKQTTPKRQLPSDGLTEDNLSYIAKSCGFGSQLYHRDCFPDFNNILSCYIESGIPVMVALSNQQYRNDCDKVGIKPVDMEDYCGHAVMCIGHEDVSEKQIEDALYQNVAGKVSIMDYDDIEKRFVFIDDNFPPYTMDSLSKPTERYSKWFGKGLGWEHCQIDHFVAPLYRKVYLEPNVAKGYLKALLASGFMSHLHGKKITMRVFLCSTRSYRDYVNRSSMSVKMKRMLAMLTLPRFVWVAELSNKEYLKKGIATGIILLDATECMTLYHNALLVSFSCGNVLYKEGQRLRSGTIVMNDFEIYNNLK